MDELKLFNRGLNQNEVQTEMNAMRPLMRVGPPPVDPALLPEGKIS